MAITDKSLLEALKDVDSENGVQVVFNCLKRIPTRDYQHNFLFVYGSLRKGEYNYDRFVNTFGQENFLYITNLTIAFSKMFDMGDYPAVMGGNYYDKINGELMYCSDQVFDVIQKMEEGAGYRMVDCTIFKDGKPFTFPYYLAAKDLIIYINQNPDIIPRVISGDWVKYNSSVIGE